jgi:hypothetical protein
MKRVCTNNTGAHASECQGRRHGRSLCYSCCQAWGPCCCFQHWMRVAAHLQIFSRCACALLHYAAVVVLTEGRPPQRGAIEWAAAQVAGGGRSVSRAGKRQRLDAAAAAAAQSEATEADAPSASVDSSGGGNGSRRELAETAESSAAAGAAAAAAAGGAAAEGAGRVVAGLVRRGREDDLLLQVGTAAVDEAAVHVPCPSRWPAAAPAAEPVHGGATACAPPHHLPGPGQTSPSSPPAACSRRSTPAAPTTPATAAPAAGQRWTLCSAAPLAGAAAGLWRPANPSSAT